MLGVDVSVESSLFTRDGYESVVVSSQDSYSASSSTISGSTAAMNWLMFQLSGNGISLM